jgi:hypothetical protein
MNITYDWKITAMKKAPALDGLSDVITHIRFDYTGTDADSGETHVFPGACPIGLPDVENFTELASLTEADVIEWVKANHPTDHMNEVIAKAIAQKVSPTNVEADMPWAPAEQIPE